MSLFWKQISEDMQAIIRQQKLLCVATASAEGRVNLAPKRLDDSVEISLLPLRNPTP